MDWFVRLQEATATGDLVEIRPTTHTFSVVNGQNGASVAAHAEYGLILVVTEAYIASVELPKRNVFGASYRTAHHLCESGVANRMACSNGDFSDCVKTALTKEGRIFRETTLSSPPAG